MRLRVRYMGACDCGKFITEARFADGKCPDCGRLFAVPNEKNHSKEALRRLKRQARHFPCHCHNFIPEKDSPVAKFIQCQSCKGWKTWEEVTCKPEIWEHFVDSRNKTLNPVARTP